MTVHPTKKRRTDKPAAPAKKPTSNPPPAASNPDSEPASPPPETTDEFDIPDNDDNDDALNDGYDSAASTATASSTSSTSSLGSLLNSTHPSTSTKKRKRNDPTIFSTSLSKILHSHLPTKSRSDPILVRHKLPAPALPDAKLELKARRVLRQQKRLELEKGRVRNVLEGHTGGDVARVVERERQLRKLAQRGVVRMFNAVRAAQVKSDEAREDVRKKGVVGVGNREQKVSEMSKQGFLDLITSSSTK